MENLIFLLILAIIIISNFARIRKKLKESAPKKEPQSPAPEKKQPQQAGWKKYLQDIWAEMQQEMQPQTGERPAGEPGGRRPSGWEDLMPHWEGPEDKTEAPPAPTGKPERDQPAEPGRAGKRQTLIESRSRQGWTPEARMGETERRKSAPPLKADRPEARRRRRFRYSKNELRRAVIWYEVLGPPVSLRDPEREQWL